MVSVIVISTPNSTRGAALIDQLSNSHDIDLKVIEASMLQGYDMARNRGIEFSEEYSSIFYGRSLSAPEIGCSDSHNRARKLLSTSSEGGIVLEDDAQIVDLGMFVATAEVFLHRNLGNSAVLSLHSTSRRSDRINLDKPYIRLKGKPKLAVGYALTPAAASILLGANTPIKYVADWPVAKVSYSVVTTEIVLHNENIPSTINTVNGSDRNQSASRFKTFRSTLERNGLTISLVKIFSYVLMDVSRNYIGHRVDRILGNVKD